MDGQSVHRGHLYIPRAPQPVSAAMLNNESVVYILFYHPCKTLRFNSIRCIWRYEGWPRIRISAIRALYSYSQHLKSANTTQYLIPFLPNILDRLLSIASQFSSDVLYLCLETLPILLTVCWSRLSITNSVIVKIIFFLSLFLCISCHIFLFFRVCQRLPLSLHCIRFKLLWIKNQLILSMCITLFFQVDQAFIASKEIKIKWLDLTICVMKWIFLINFCIAYQYT